MFRRLYAVVLTIVLVGIPVGGASAAQTPVPAVPMSCLVEPVEFLALLALLNDIDDARLEQPISSVSLAEVVPGTPIYAEDMAEITDTTTELIGCVNSFQVFSAIALLTEQFQARLVLEVIEGNGLDALAAQLPILASETAETQGIQDIPIRAAWYAEGNDREIMAILEPVATDPSAQRSFLVTYVFSVDRWLIDDVQLITGS